MVIMVMKQQFFWERYLNIQCAAMYKNFYCNYASQDRTLGVGLQNLNAGVFELGFDASIMYFAV